ncbi:hypothetical protein [Candidatus Aciduliprofundum boonei]|uniref:LtrC-like protein n=1 Tax=Aciduliprofundum boonei (strain DSM 19572 / T469) TaxID=439481 RepID=D3T9N9_ACIB4|nr:hypothetical protein [Candidatus Aciduliprofundum boonei]ADD08818.1 hypothetical protein Aboo_1009 [Aciduliprofundum boonei T469]HII55409.1 hypothetical protein [Candidatus Aciduliprofundum boonei]
MKKMRYSKEEVKRYYDDVSKFLNTKFKEGLKELTKSERVQDLLKVKNLSYNYSLYNTLLIISQKPELAETGELVLPRYKWEKLGRHINKDAQPIWIWRPNPKTIYEYQKRDLPQELKDVRELALKSKSPQEFAKALDEKVGNLLQQDKVSAMGLAGAIAENYGDNQKALTNLYYDLKRGYMTAKVPRGERMYFKPEKVYAESDTHGKPLPDLRFKTLTGNEYRKFYEMIRDSSPIPVEEIYTIGNTNKLKYHGKYDMKEGKITIVRSKSYNHMLGTLIHELAHAIRHKERMMTPDNNFEEAVVESTSISILSRMGAKDALQKRGEYVLTFLNAQKEEDLDKAGNKLFHETNRTVRKLLEKVPAINHAISEVDRQRIEYEAKLMKEAKKEMAKEKENSKEVEAPKGPGMQPQEIAHAQNVPNQHSVPNQHKEVEVEL